jgi:hypothetical protein
VFAVVAIFLAGVREQANCVGGRGALVAHQSPARTKSAACAKIHQAVPRPAWKDKVKRLAPCILHAAHIVTVEAAAKV